MNIIFEFVGGPLDGQTVTGQAGAQDEADRYFALTHHGKVGQRFRVASGYAVDMLAREELKEETPHQFQQHRYVVTDRVEAEEEILVRVRYLEKENQQRRRVSIRDHLEGSRPSAETFEGKIERFLLQTARSLAQTYSHCWPASLSAEDSTAIGHVLLHWGHILLGENFLVVTDSRHPTGGDRSIDLLAVASSQDWFIASQLCSLRDPDGLRQLLADVDGLQRFWLDPRIAIGPCRKHVARIASHCRNGYGVLVGFHGESEQQEQPSLLELWRRRTGDGQAFGHVARRLQELQAHWVEPMPVRAPGDGRAYYLLSAFFQIDASHSPRM